MRYLQFTPDPDIATDKDCENVAALMKRLSEEAGCSVDTDIVYFKMKKPFVIYWKYRILLENTDNLSKVKSLKAKIESACVNREESIALKKFICMHGKDGILTPYEKYIAELIKQIKSAECKYMIETEDMLELLAS